MKFKENLAICLIAPSKKNTHCNRSPSPFTFYFDNKTAKSEKRKKKSQAKWFIIRNCFFMSMLCRAKWKRGKIKKNNNTKIQKKSALFHQKSNISSSLLYINFLLSLIKNKTARLNPREHSFIEHKKK